MPKILILFVLIALFLAPLTFARTSMDMINQRVCTRFEEDLSKLAAIMEELRDRKGIKETRVAFGGVDNQIKSADYWITYTAEAVAYQRVQKFSSNSSLRSSLEVLKRKVLKAKAEVGKAL